LHGCNFGLAPVNRRTFFDMNGAADLYRWRKCYNLLLIGIEEKLIRVIHISKTAIGVLNVSGIPTSHSCFTKVSAASLVGVCDREERRLGMIQVKSREIADDLL
jgi:hypothetical protein